MPTIAAREWMVSGPAEATPPRRPGSVRRTATIHMRWPAGLGSQMRMLGRARDLLTPGDGGPARILAEDVLHVGAAPDRTIEDIRAVPDRPALERLVGARGGGRLRSLLASVVPSECEAPLYLLLDDLSGATLVGGFALLLQANLRGQPKPLRRMEGICIGFQPGASSLNPDGTARFSHDVREVAPLQRADDQMSWHEVSDIAGISMRRARRIDVCLGDVIEIDSFFQDSATTPEGGRVAVHEYVVRATADSRSQRLLSVTADPRVLPYRECPMAVANVGRMVGTPLTDLRMAVLEQFKGIDGCTHLNDVLRSLAEVPALVRPLQGPALGSTRH
jgi:Protein of unknown function (DUF2889)